MESDRPDEKFASDDVSLKPLHQILLGEQTVENILDLVTTITSRTIEGADAVSVTLIRDGEPFTSTYTKDIARELDGVQYSTPGGGPCVSALSSHQQISTMLEEATEWPEFVQEARRRGVTYVLSTPLTVARGPLGALNIYGMHSEPFTASQERTAGLLADQASVVLSNALGYAGAESLNNQLRQALETRDMIGQAKGILMERHGIGADEGFDMLRKMSQRANRRLRDMAFELVQTVERRRSGTKR